MIFKTIRSLRSDFLRKSLPVDTHCAGFKPLLRHGNSCGGGMELVTILLKYLNLP